MSLKKNSLGSSTAFFHAGLRADATLSPVSTPSSGKIYTRLWLGLSYRGLRQVGDYLATTIHEGKMTIHQLVESGRGMFLTVAVKLTKP